MDSSFILTGSAVAEPVFEGTVHTASLAVCTVLVLFVVVLGSFGNGIIILSPLKCKRMRSSFDLLIVNLAGTDFILCTCLSPVFLYLLFTDPPAPKLFCGSFLFLGTACGMLSLLTIVTIALHRQARVVGKIKSRLTPTKTGVILGTVWLLSLGTALGGTLHVTSNWDDSYQNCQVIINSPNLRTHNFVLFFVCPIVTIACVIITFSYTVIGRAVRNQTKIIRVNAVSINIYKSSRNKIPLDQKLLPETKQRDKTKKVTNTGGRQCPCCNGQAILDKENKAVTMCLVVIFTILLCWTPLVISHFVELITGESIILYQVKLCGIALVFLNSALDPYIYGQNNGRMKKKYSRLLWDFIRCQCKSVTKSRRFAVTGKQQAAKLKSNSQNDQDTRTLNLASPKQVQRFVDKRGNIPKQRTYTSNLLLYQSNRALARKIPYGAALRKGGSQVGDIEGVMHDVKSFVHKSCCHTGIPDDQSLI